MTKVWVISGIVLAGTGLSLALFGGWLSGNQNCDAADLGRACMAASLGLSIIGASLAAAGWMRVQRLGGEDTDEATEGDLFARRPGLVLLAFSVVGLVLLAAVFPVPHIPVDVYDTPPPAFDADPAALLPATLAGHDRTTPVTLIERSHSVSEQNETVWFGDPSVTAEADYQGGVFVRITRFNATNLTEAQWEAKLNETYPPQNGTNGTRPPRPPSVENATRFADDFLGQKFFSLDPTKGERLCARDGPRHWFRQDSPTQSELAWRTGSFVFEVFAPDAAARNQVASLLG